MEGVTRAMHGTVCPARLRPRLCYCTGDNSWSLYCFPFGIFGFVVPVRCFDVFEPGVVLW